MAGAREYLKEKEKQEKTWRRDFNRESRSTYRYPFCPEQVFIIKRREICLKIHFFRLLLTWLNWGVNSQYLSEREDGRDRTRRESQSGHGALFYGQRLRFEFHGRRNTKNSWSVCRGATDTEKTTTIAWRKGLVLTKETHSRLTRGRKEWRAKRKLEFRGMVEDWSSPKKRESHLSQVWFTSCLRYAWHQAVHLKLLRHVLHQDFFCSEIFLNLNFCILPRVVHSKLFR